MLPSLSRGLRLALLMTVGTGLVGVSGLGVPAAYAQSDDDDEGGDDGGDDGEGKDGEGEDDEEDDKDQPPVTSGGLFTMKTYPVRELDRPLTMTQKITQLRFGVGTDVSAGGAFETYGVNLEAIHGLKDNVSLIGGFTSAYNIKQFALYAGFEAALAYDLIDFRLAARLSRPASISLPTGDPPTGGGEPIAGDVKGSIDIGFPFRYAAKPEIAIVALNTLMSIDFDSKPDLNPSLGIATNPIPALSVVVFAQLQIVDFNTDAENLKIPATARIQFSPSRKLDIGGEFTFLNMKPPEGQKFYDNRFLTLFVAARFGK